MCRESGFSSNTITHIKLNKNNNLKLKQFLSHCDSPETLQLNSFYKSKIMEILYKNFQSKSEMNKVKFPFLVWKQKAIQSWFHLSFIHSFSPVFPENPKINSFDSTPFHKHNIKHHSFISTETELSTVALKCRICNRIFTSIAARRRHMASR